MVVVEARSLGRREALVPRWSVPIPFESGGGADGLTLRVLIERIVRAEVAAFERRQQAQRFVHVLSQREIAAGHKSGRFDPGGHERSAPVDVEAAVGVALQGFEDGLYLVVLDGVEQRELDREVHVNEDSHVLFLRLVFLAGA